MEEQGLLWMEDYSLRGMEEHVLRHGRTRKEGLEWWVSKKDGILMANSDGRTSAKSEGIIQFISDGRKILRGWKNKC